MGRRLGFSYDDDDPRPPRRGRGIFTFVLIVIALWALLVTALAVAAWLTNLTLVR